MKTKTLLILSIVLVLSMVVCVTTYAIDSNNATSTVGSYYINSPADSSFIFTMADGSSINLTYEQSINSPTGIRNIYLDADKNQYWIDSTGDAVGFLRESSYLKEIPTPDEEVDYTDSINEKNAIQIATMHCQTMYGDAFDDFSLNYCELNDYEYSLEFTINYGVNDCIIGANCYVDVLLDGTVTVSAIHNQKEIENFDESVLENITIEQLEAIAEANARAVYMDTYVNFEIVKTRVCKSGNNYSLEIITNVFYTDETGEEIGISETYYYGIS